MVSVKKLDREALWWAWLKSRISCSKKSVSSFFTKTGQTVSVVECQSAEDATGAYLGSDLPPTVNKREREERWRVL